jgi:hypothetical protein
MNGGKGGTSGCGMNGGKTGGRGCSGLKAIFFFLSKNMFNELYLGQINYLYLL